MAKLVTTISQSESGYSTDIVAIDGREVSRNHVGGFQLMPGRHTVEVKGRHAPVRNYYAGGAIAAAVGAAIAATKVSDSGPMVACFIARPERTYEIRTYSEGGVWQIQVVDQTSTYDVKSPCKTAIKLHP